MDKSQLTFSHIQSLINYELSRENKNRQLTELESAVLEAGWEEVSYGYFGRNNDYEEGTLKNVGSALYRELSKCLGKQISKNTFRKFIFSEIENKSSYLNTIFVEVYGKPPIISEFRGRKQEISYLDEKTKNTSNVFITGAHGVGKTSISAKVFEIKRKTNEHDAYVWYYSCSASPEEDINDVLFDIFKQKFENPFDEFLNSIKKKKYFIVIDGIDQWFQVENLEKTKHIISKIVQSNHVSNILFSSQRIIQIIHQLRETGREVSIYNLDPLSYLDSLEIITEYGIKGTEIERFIKSFQGNPLYLRDACRKIQKMGGTVDILKKDITSFAKDFFIEDIKKISNSLTENEKIVFDYILNISDNEILLLDEIMFSIYKDKNISILEIDSAIENLKNYTLISTNKESDETVIYLSKLLKSR